MLNFAIAIFETFKYGVYIFAGNFVFCLVAIAACGKDNVPSWAKTFSNALWIANGLVNLIGCVLLVMLAVWGVCRLVRPYKIVIVRR